LSSLFKGKSSEERFDEILEALKVNIQLPVTHKMFVFVEESDLGERV